MQTLQLQITTRDGRRARLNYTGPENWGEVSPRQAVGIFRFRSLVDQRSESLFPALKLLYGMKPRHMRWLFDADLLRRQGMTEQEASLGSGDVFVLTDRELTLQLGQKLIDTVRWVGLTDPGTDFIVRSFRRFDYRYGTPGVLIGRIGQRTRYYAPADALGDCTFEEFITADKAYHDGDLVLLAATLYRPRSQGKREVFRLESAKARAKVFARLEPALLRLIAAQFQATLEYLQRCFRYVFPEYQSSGKKSGKPGTWLDVAIGMAKLDATKIGAIEQLNLYLALKVLNEQCRQAEEMEKQIEKMNKK